ncbi:MAG: hypothetical protein HQL67_09905 [Magnetococcales bacterium]|nr:hypothetical protein [Magnetococcales bacterium]
MIDGLLNPIQNLPDNRLFLIVVVLLMARIRRITTANRFLIGLINLIGTFFHELAHYLVGWLLLARPSGFSVWPKAKLGGGLVLGSVSFANLRFYNALPTALAPLLLVILAYYIDQEFFILIQQAPLSYLIYIFIMVILLENAIPSSTDLKVAFSQWGGTLFYLLITTLYFFWDELARFFI